MIPPRLDPLKFYSTKEWRKLRARWKRSHPRCVRCGSRDNIIVDHVVGLLVAPERRLDWLNVQSLCLPCHNEKTAADRAGRDVRPHGGCDINGNPTDPLHPWSTL